MRVFLSALALSAACFYWLMEERVLRLMGKPTKDNCLTWAWRNFDYSAGDGFMAHKSKSGWFPHIVVVKGAQARELTLVEYVPTHRVDQTSPPHKFDGFVQMQTYTQDA